MTPLPIQIFSLSGSRLGPEAARHRLVDDHHRRCTRAVSRSVNVAAAHDRDLEHFEVAGRHGLPAAAAVERAIGRAAAPMTMNGSP